MLKKLISIFVILLLSTNVFAHSGNTDQYGCHTDKNGNYHCHNAKSESTGNIDWTIVGIAIGGIIVVNYVFNKLKDSYQSLDYDIFYKNNSEDNNIVEFKNIKTNIDNKDTIYTVIEFKF